MDTTLRDARKSSGLARFERTAAGWRTPGTRAAGVHAMLKQACWDLLAERRKAEGGAPKTGGTMADTTLRVKYTASGLCTVAHPAAPLGQHEDAVTHEVIEIPPGVSTTDVVRRYAGTAILPSYGAVVAYGDLGPDRILTRR